MSIYNELNDIQLDLASYEEEPLTELEQKRWEKRVLKKLHPRRRSTSIKWIGTAIAAVLLLGVTLPFDKVSLAQMPFVSGLLERFINAEKPVDYSTYKTAIGETAENAYGKLTLNEVLVDADRLLISSTFEPAKGVKFNYQTQLPPHVLVNGEDLQETRGSQSVKVSDGIYTIYGDIKLRELPLEGLLHVKITYNTFSTRQRQAIEEPWVFEIEVSAGQIGREMRTFNLDKTITLYNGEQVTLKKVLISPVSTLVYYELSKASESIGFKLISASGKEIPQREGYRSNDIGDTSYIRFEAVEPFDIDAETYSLVPVTMEKNEEAGPPIQINE
ncbi:DUF4179 domain-containing protein [Paenibacillus fonticola]|uniref:DUF4179 domain-containing protein n=1 Tax=Paenibacillus fonticola TaxID=379896 RepID=UPI000379CDDB|nr:DUF4179 domain-containing protein [Paenibacillus fonticola]